MDSFEFNKIAGAVLATALGVMALSIVSEMIFSPAEAEHPGMVVEVAENTGGETGGATTGAEVVPIAVRLASANVDAGATAAKKCAACHTFGKGEGAKTGPNLYGVVGGPLAHMEGFKYSEAILAKKAEGVTWTFENLDHFITAPKSFIPGTAMGYAGIKRDDERANLIAYLRTLSDNPVPLPDASAAAPAPAEAPAAEAPSAPGAEAQPLPQSEQPPAVQTPPGEPATPPPAEQPPAMQPAPPAEAQPPATNPPPAH